MPRLDYETPNRPEPPKWHQGPYAWAPMLMSIYGLPCCFLTGFVGDSPLVNTTLVGWAALLMAGTIPLAWLTLYLSHEFVLAKGPAWYHARWIVPVVHILAILLLLQLAGLKVH